MLKPILKCLKSMLDRLLPLVKDDEEGKSGSMDLHDIGLTDHPLWTDKGRAQCLHSLL